jgi:hypothetical protein
MVTDESGVEADATEKTRIHLASWDSRFFAWLIDVILVGAILSVVGQVVGVLSLTTGTLLGGPPGPSSSNGPKRRTCPPTSSTSPPSPESRAARRHPPGASKVTSRTSKRAPSASLSPTETVQLWASTTRWTMVNPMPTPASAAL